MKKLILLITIAVSFVLTVKAQEFNLGVKAGVNISNLVGREKYDNKTSFHFGIVGEYQISEKYSLQPEFVYSVQGTGMSKQTSSKYTLNYINVPLMVKYYVVKGFNLQAGPQLGFVAVAKEVFGENDENELILKDRIRPVDFGVNFGLGYKFGGNFFVEARYNLGLTHMYKYVTRYSKRNSVFQISVGCLF